MAQELLQFLNKFKAENNRKGPHFQTLSQAIRLKWNEKRIVALSRRLDKFRQMLELWVAVDSRDAVKESIELLEKASKACSINQQDILATIQQGQSNIHSALQAQSVESRSITEEISSINQATHQKQEQILRTIDAFIDAVKDHKLFPEKTKEALNEWTGSRQLITCSHFFWYAGTELQKNVQGLLRTLLYQIFNQRRDLISRSFPGRYRTAISR